MIIEEPLEEPLEETTEAIVKNDRPEIEAPIPGPLPPAEDTTETISAVESKTVAALEA